MLHARAEWDDVEAPVDARLQACLEWEGDESVADEGADSGSDSDADAEDELLMYMIELLQSRTLLPQHFTTIMHWASKLQHPQSLSPYAFRPNAPSGHAQRHLNSVLKLGTGSEKLYRMSVPGYDPQVLGRSSLTVHVLPAHEQLAELVQEDPSKRERLREAVEQRALPPAYFDHPLVHEHGSADNPVRPLAVFVDGVPYSITDSLVGFWVQDVISGARCLTALIRKRRGCRGWCTYFPIFIYLAWFLIASKMESTPSGVTIMPLGMLWI